MTDDIEVQRRVALHDQLRNRESEIGQLRTQLQAALAERDVLRERAKKSRITGPPNWAWREADHLQGKTREAIAHDLAETYAEGVADGEAKVKTERDAALAELARVKSELTDLRADADACAHWHTRAVQAEADLAAAREKLEISQGSTRYWREYAESACTKIVDLEADLARERARLQLIFDRTLDRIRLALPTSEEELAIPHINNVRVSTREDLDRVISMWADAALAAEADKENS